MSGQGRGPSHSNGVANVGERIIPASRRPDGTMRKEIRVRAGYIPQDEVERYVARGTRPKSDGTDLPPGMDPEYAAQQMAAKKKAAKKNEKRKEKKAAAASGPTAAEVSSNLAGLSIKGEVQRKAVEETSAARRDNTQTTQDETQNPEKQLRNLKKKIRQAEELQVKISSRGGEATAEENEKIGRLPGWREQAAELEKQISS